MDLSKVDKQYKENLAQAQEENEILTKLVGKVTIKMNGSKKTKKLGLIGSEKYPRAQA